MRYLITLLTILSSMLLFLTWGFNTAAKADTVSSEYVTTTIGSIVQSKMNGTEVDVSKLMEQELAKVGHQFALESINILQKYLPTILDNVMTEMRLEADKSYKCELLKDSSIKDKDCL